MSSAEHRRDDSKAQAYVAHKIAQYVLPERSGTKLHGLARPEAVLTALTKARAKGYAALRDDANMAEDRFLLRVTRTVLLCNPGARLSAKVMRLKDKPVYSDVLEVLPVSVLIGANEPLAFQQDPHWPTTYGQWTNTLPYAPPRASVAVNGEQFAVQLHVPKDAHLDGDFFPFTVKLGNVEVYSGAYRFSDDAATRDSAARADAPSTLVVRLPLYDESVLRKARKLGLPVNELHLLVDRDSATGRCVVREATLRCFLRVRDAMHGASTKMVATVPQSGLSHHGMFAHKDARELPAYASATATKSAAAADTTPQALQVLRSFISGALGSNAHWSAAAYQGTDELFYAGNVDNKRAQWRIGQLTEAVTVVSIVRYLVQNSSSPSVDFHQPGVLRKFMERAGTLPVWEALFEAYSRTFGGLTPMLTIHHLLTHTSGLPEFLPHSAVELRDALARIKERRQDDSSVMEAMVRVLKRDLEPIAPAGAVYHHSSLGALVLRMCMPDWHTDAPERIALSDMAALHLQRATFHCADATLAPMCARGAGDAATGSSSSSAGGASGRLSEAATRQDQGLYSLYSGLNAEVGELARFFSDVNPWAAGRADNSSYGFMPYLLVPQTVLSKRDRIYAGFGGWTQVRVKIGSDQERNDEVVALVQIGHTPGAHVAMAVRIPQWRLAGVLCTNADLAVLSGDPRGSLYTLISQFANTLLRSGTLSQATFDAQSLHAVELQPPRSAEYMRYRQYCRRYGEYATEAHLRGFAQLRDVRFYSLMERLVGQADQVLWFDTAASGRDTANKQTPPSFLRLNIQYAVVANPQASVSRVDSLLLAYDPQPQLPESGPRGVLRIVDPLDGLMREQVTVAALESGDVVVSTRGRNYVPRTLVEQIMQLQVGGAVMQRAAEPVQADRQQQNVTPQMRHMPAEQLQRMMLGSANAPVMSNSVLLTLLGNNGVQDELIGNTRAGFGAGLVLGAIGGGLVGLTVSPFVSRRYGWDYYPYAPPGWRYCRRFPWAPECRTYPYW